jgi:hypothetical protein
MLMLEKKGHSGFTGIIFAFLRRFQKQASIGVG